jgi:hypothetical protein
MGSAATADVEAAWPGAIYNHMSVMDAMLGSSSSSSLTY